MIVKPIWNLIYWLSYIWMRAFKSPFAEMNELIQCCWWLRVGAWPSLHCANISIIIILHGKWARKKGYLHKLFYYSWAFVDVAGFIAEGTWPETMRLPSTPASDMWIICSSSHTRKSLVEWSFFFRLFRFFGPRQRQQRNANMCHRKIPKTQRISFFFLDICMRVRILFYVVFVLFSKH